MTLKYEGIAEVGQVIKAYDFKPGRPDCPDMFVLGVVKQKGWVSGYADYEAYIIECIYDSRDQEKDGHFGRSRKGQTIYVPYETMMDYDGRVSLV